MAIDLHKPKDRAKYRKAVVKRRDNFFQPASRLMAAAFNDAGKKVVASIASGKVSPDQVSKAVQDCKPIFKSAVEEIWNAAGSDGYQFASENFGGTLYGGKFDIKPLELPPLGLPKLDQKLFGIKIPAWLTHVANYMTTGKVGDRRIDGITSDTEESIQKDIFAGMEQEEGIPQIADRVQSHFDNMSEGRSNVIARSETVDAFNQATLQQGKDAGSTLWLMWIATDDTKTRPEHAAMDGKTVPPDEEFECEDGTTMPGEAVNCRCCLGYAVPSTDE